MTKAAAEKPTKSPFMLLTSTILAKARIKWRSGREERVVSNPFLPNQFLHPSTVMEAAKAAGVAMDAAPLITANAAWAQSIYYGAFAEGMTFLGYAELAIMAQRPEYRRLSEVIARAMTRRWIKLKSVSDDESKEAVMALIEKRMGELSVKDAFQKMAEEDGYFGRSHLYLDTGDTDNPDELRTPLGNGDDLISKIKVSPKKPLRGIKAVEAVWCYPTQYNSNDPLKSTWYNPDTWFVLGKQLHATRLLTFIGREVPDLLKPAYSFGGLSLTQMAKPYVDNWLRTRQSVSDIVNAYSVMVLKTNMTDALNTNEGEALFTRAQLFNDLRDNRGLMIVDKNQEDFDNVAAPLGTLDVLQAQTQEHMAAVCGIPIVILLGIQPAGLNASSEGEIRTFYDWIHACQEQLFRPHLTTVINMIQLSLFGAVDPDISFDFEPLYAMTPLEIAQEQSAKADVDTKLLDAGVLHPEEVRARLAADPDSGYEGLEVEDVPEPPAAEEAIDPNDPNAPQGPDKGGEGAAEKPGAEGEEDEEEAPDAEQIGEEGEKDTENQQ